MLRFTRGVKLDELQVLAWQAGAGHHGGAVSCAGVGGGAAEKGASIPTVETRTLSIYNITIKQVKHNASDGDRDDSFMSRRKIIKSAGN